MPAGTNPFLPVVLLAVFVCLFAILVYGGLLISFVASVAASSGRFAGVVPFRIAAVACAWLAIATFFGTSWVLAHSDDPHVKSPPAKQYYFVFSGLYASFFFAYALMSCNQRSAASWV
jgi:hypothetical protein